MPIRGLPSIQSNSYPAHFSIEAAIRPNILALHPYRCARDDYQSGILLDANENALGHSIPPSSSAEESLDEMKLHRYPDPAQVEVKKRIAELRGLPDTDHIFLGVGSDEIIDLLMRVCCVPEKEKIITTPPTYGMYAVCAQVNDLPIVKVPLRTEGGAFQLQIQEVINQSSWASMNSIDLRFLRSKRPFNPIP
jgi:histidinol-phosphate aminotransferase